MELLSRLSIAFRRCRLQKITDWPYHPLGIFEQAFVKLEYNCCRDVALVLNEFGSQRFRKAPNALLLNSPNISPSLTLQRSNAS